MKTKQPNHICKNPNCPNGIKGEPKHYYACDFCDKTQKWRSMACSIECYEAYMKLVLDARGTEVSIDAALPNRTDMSKEEVKELMHKPLNEVVADTKEELKEYLADGSSIADAIETINAEIDAQAHAKKFKK